MNWVYGAVVIWVTLSVSTALALGKAISIADFEQEMANR